jgi:hypothetical protein
MQALGKQNRNGLNMAVDLRGNSLVCPAHQILDENLPDRVQQTQLNCLAYVQLCNGSISLQDSTPAQLAKMRNWSAMHRQCHLQLALALLILFAFGLH